MVGVFMQKTICSLISIVLCMLPGCRTSIQQRPIAKQVTLSAQSQRLTETTTPGNPPITIWVHGTRLLPQGVLQKFFYSKPGLHHYTEIEPKYYQRKIAQTLINADPINYPAEEFYLFGWSGKLSFDERKKAAQVLYQDLKELINNYKNKYGTAPFIRMVAHSHGGNVILMLEEVKNDYDTDLVIDEVILLAVPVQTPTMNYICSPLFKKIYSLYSILDVLQVIDPQGLQQEDAPLFSQRAFGCQEKIEQIAIKINDRSIMHIEFVKPQFLASLPAIIQEINKWRAHCAQCSHGWIHREKCLCIKIRK